jgi:hypothetical protein
LAEWQFLFFLLPLAIDHAIARARVFEQKWWSLMITGVPGPIWVSDTLTLTN